MHNQPEQITSRLLIHWAVFIFITILSVLLWIEYGLDGGFTADDWATLATVDRGTPDISVNPRPVLYVSWNLARFLTPDSVIGTNLVALILIAAKGILVYAILRCFNLNIALAVGAAALAVVFPVDNAIMYLGALSIHAAVFGYLLALYAWLMLAQTRNFLWLLPTFGGLLLSLGIYETGYPIVAFTPLLLLLLERRISRRFLLLTALWYLVPFVLGVRLIYLYTQRPDVFAYQSSLAADLDPAAMLTSFFRNYEYHFFTGWQVALNFVTSTHRLIGMVGSVLTFALVYVLWQRRDERNIYPLWVGIGLAMLGLGFVMYLPSALRDVVGRTFYFSSIGAALAIVALWIWLMGFLPERVSRVLFAGGVALVVGLGTSAILAQRVIYVERMEEQRFYLREMLQPVGNLPSDTKILLIDQSENQKMKRIFFGSTFYLNSIIGTVYNNHSIIGVLCYPDEAEFWGFTNERCEFTEEGAKFSTTHPLVPFVQPYEELVVITYDDETGMQLVEDLSEFTTAAEGYRPEAITNPQQLPARFYTMLDFPQIR